MTSLETLLHATPIADSIASALGHRSILMFMMTCKGVYIRLKGWFDRHKVDEFLDRRIGNSEALRHMLRETDSFMIGGIINEFRELPTKGKDNSDILL